MARRGTPVSRATIEAVKERRLRGESLREISRALRLAVNTVRKYTQKFDTESLSRHSFVA